MAILEIAAVTSVLCTAVYARRRSTSVLSSVQKVMKRLDRRYQTWIKTRLDPRLFGQQRQQQMALLAHEDQPALPSAPEQDINRRLGFATIAFGSAVLSATVLPAMSLVMIGMVTFLTARHAAEAYHDLRQNGKVTLNLITTIYFIGMWLAGYFVFGTAISILYNLGTKLRFVMEADSRDRLQHVFGQQSRVALRVIDGVELEVATEELQVGDMIVVNAGEALPIDGVITDGLAQIDQHMLTGEAQPVEKQPGDAVFAGTLVLSGRVFVQVEQAGDQTMATRIGDILVETAAHKTAIESRGLELADKGALPNLVVSLVAYPFFGLTGATAALGAGFGYNLRTVSILSMFNYLQLAAQQSILVKDARALEQLQTIDTFVFDKTGTLTQEIPEVARIHGCHPDYTEDDVLRYAAAAEYRQTHPIAKAIIAAASDLDLPEIQDASYEVGYGIQVSLEGQQIRVGSLRFMQLEDMLLPERITSLQTACQQQGHSLVLVACGDAVIGALELHTRLRPETTSVLDDLRRRGLRLVIISGDQTEPTRHLAEALGVDDYFAETLPENKATLITQLQREGRKVCFIGDGMNDAIALQQADVGISLCGATTIATDAAQIVLMDRGLARLDDLLNLAHQFDRTMQQGFWTTMVPGIICVGGVFFLHFGIVAAEVLFQAGFFSGLGVAMKPLWDQKKQRLSDNSNS